MDFKKRPKSNFEKEMNFANFVWVHVSMTSQKPNPGDVGILFGVNV